MSAVAWAKLTAVWQNLMTTFKHKTSPLRGYDLLNKPINFGRFRCSLRSLALKLSYMWKSYMWTAEWRIIWRTIIAVIYAIFAIAKRKPEKKNISQACTARTLSLRNCKCCVYNCDDLPSYNSKLRSSHIWFSYIHNFINLLFTGL